MKNPKCKICGRTCSSGVKIEPEDIAPEVKKTLFFCSARCAKVFIASVKRERKKKYNQACRASLENTDREPNEQELALMLCTLTAKEKELLSAIAVGILLAEDRTCKEFYKNLKERTRKL